MGERSEGKERGKASLSITLVLSGWLFCFYIGLHY